ncbi:B cell differentiation [Homalodisca vitripennis]|nr:B cell differentiation [Homalodisca vitripennis]
MLPSMPLLMTPIKELQDDSSDTSDDSPSPHHLLENDHIFGSSGGEAVSQEGLDQIVTLNECVLQSTIKETEKAGEKQNTPEKRTLPEPTSAQKKKKKTQHKKTLAAVTPESGEHLEKSALNFAEAYFYKVKNQLDTEKWTQFVQELLEFERRSDKQPAELYRRMQELLSPHTELIDEFLGFLLPHQALEVNRFMDYLLLVKMKEFLRKLDMLLLKRQTRQVFSALESLAVRSVVTISDVRATILPLLKSSPLLTNEFLQLLPGERPPDSLMTDFEQVDFKDDSLFETIVVPDLPDPYGNANCICPCHATQKNRHCVSCGIKYLNGRVYLQHGKVLRPAKVTFKGRKHSDLSKWEEDKCRSRKRMLPKTMLSPSLDNRLNADSEDDCGVKKSPRTPRIRTARSKACKKGMIENKEEEALEGIFPLAEVKNTITDNNITRQLLIDCEMKHDENDEHEFDEIVMENECNTEEDEEEEEFNKCSENESSLEAEDIAKELESGNDYSFEDDEGEDIDDSEVNIEMSKLTSENDSQESVSMELSQDGLKLYMHDNSSGHKARSDIVQSKNILEDGIIASGVKFVAGVQKLTADCDNQSDEKGSFSENFKVEMDVVKVEEVIKVEWMTEDDFNIDDDQTNCADFRIETEKSEIKYEQQLSVKCEAEASMENKLEEQCVGERDISCDDGVEQGTSGQDNVCKEWTREEDKIILQTFQHENGLEQTFETASLQLPNRSKEEIQERFKVLFKLLKEMISDESNSNS